MITNARAQLQEKPRAQPWRATCACDNGLGRGGLRWEAPSRSRPSPSRDPLKTTRATTGQ
eukprot:11207408-Lingulodinium_polyedra.AAC.1